MATETEKSGAEEHIDVRDDASIIEWMERLGVSRGDLVAAVTVVGSRADDVRAYLESLRK